MTDRQYECIIAIADEKTISGAAKKLYVSQASLSQMLSHVETEHGTPLFIRNTSGMTLTHAGTLYINMARQILHIRQEFKKRIEETKNNRRGKLTIGIAIKRSWLLMPLVLPAYMREFPEVEIVFAEHDQNELDKLILQGNIDIAFTAKSYLSKNIIYEHIYNEYLMLILPKKLSILNHSENNLKKDDFKLLKGFPFILTRDGNELRRIINNIFSDFSFTPNILLESHSMDVCFQMSAAGLGATIIPDTLQKVHASKYLVTCYKIAEKYHRKISMMYHKDTYPSFIMRNFIRISKKAILAAVTGS